MIRWHKLLLATAIIGVVSLTVATFLAPISGYYHDNVDDVVLCYDEGFVYELENNRATIVARYHKFPSPYGWNLVSIPTGTPSLSLTPGLFSLSDGRRTQTRLWFGYDIADYEITDPDRIREIVIQE